jgi:glyoxylate reductase
VNTARGDVIDEDALIQLLKEGKMAGAGSTCSSMSRRSIRSCWKLAAKGKVVLLPHMGSATIEGRIDMGEKVIINIRALGRRPPPAGPRFAAQGV